MHWIVRPVIAGIVLCLVLATGTAWSKSLEDRKWIRMESRHFTVHSAISERKTRELLLHLEATFSSIAAPASRADGMIPTTITVVRHDEDLEALGVDADRFVGKFIPGLRRNRMIIRYTGQAEDVETVLHEYWHYLVANLVHFPFPMWYREGSAEYFSSSQIRKNNLEFGLPKTSSVRAIVAYDWIPMREIIDSRGVWGETDKERLQQAYAQSWLLAHYLYSRPGGDNTIRTEWRRYGQLRLDGATEINAFEGAFGIDIDDLDKLLHDYFDADKFVFSATSIVDLKRNFDPQSFALTRAEAAIELAEYLLPNVAAISATNDAEAQVARRLIEVAMANDTTKARARACLARLYQFDGNYDAATVEIEAAAEAAPDEIGIQLDAHRLFWIRASQGDLDAAQRADKYLARAEELDAQNPEFRYYEARALLRRGAADSALQLLERAARQAPASFEIKALLAEAYARSGRRTEAMQLANELLLYGHVSEDIVTFARELVNWLEGR